ncbi:MAG: ATP-dependent DNA helicase RecQ [Bacteroidia bacterium]
MNDSIHQILLKYWGYSQFRPLQEDIISAVLEGKDTLALLPTGGGKSICFQVPALLKEGICIVVSPLIALMQDQVENLQQRDISAIAITSAMQKREIDIALDNCIYGKIKFLYLSPERLQTEIVRVRLQKMKINLIAVDEAHCISQWGYDFRPSYLHIAELRELLPNVPVLALTATATPQVANDIQQKLFFKKENIIQKSFERKNLAYVVINDENKLERLKKIISKLSGSGIIYVRNRKKTEEIARFLNQYKSDADFYHAGLNNTQRSAKQDNWKKNKTRIIVCTNAFGMGIDKPDVRFVVHYDVPDCIESYFQEAGRAGRDEQKAYAILLYSESDRYELARTINNNFPSIETINKVYQSLGNYFQLAVGSGQFASFDFDISDFCNRFELNAYHVYSALKILEKEEYLTATEALHQPSRIHVNVNKEELYKFQVANSGYDNFIKLLLRSYTGIFDGFVKINEKELASRAETSKEKIIELLHFLDKMNLLAYVPQTEMPQVIYMKERLPIADLLISKAHVSEQKEKAEKRMEWMLHYATSIHKCRSRVLLAYFGETETYRCGICDVCLERNKLDLSELEFDTIKEALTKELQEKKMLLNDLIHSIKNYRDDKTIKVIQWLLDNDELVYDEENKLHLKK